MKADTSRARLEASRPQAAQFSSQQEYEEAMAHWLSHAGRVLALTSPSPASPQPSRSTDAT